MFILALVLLVSAVWYNGCIPRQEDKDCINNQGKTHNSTEKEKVQKQNVLQEAK